MKIAFVIHRYGASVTGGAETLCYQLANRLRPWYKITVITTCAQDYTTWKNHFPAGESTLEGMKVVRFPTERERDMPAFNRYSDWIYSHPHREEDEHRWLELQGPYAPSLIEYVKKHRDDFDLFIFFTYLYYPTYWGLKEVGYKSILLPTAHQEPPIFLEIYQQVFSSPVGIIFNTSPEAEFVQKNFPLKGTFSATIGTGIEIPEKLPVKQLIQKHRLTKPYILYAGRIEPGKGCQELCHYFVTFKEREDEVELVFMGNLLMELPRHPSIRYLGYLPEEEKLAAMKKAEVVVIPSPLESLSLSLLEAFSVGTPVLVDERSEVLKEHCLRSNGGLYYRGLEEFCYSLKFLLSSKQLRKLMGNNGFAYVRENYDWQKIVKRYRKFLSQVFQQIRETKKTSSNPSIP